MGSVRDGGGWGQGVWSLQNRVSSPAGFSIIKARYRYESIELQAKISSCLIKKVKQWAPHISFASEAIHSWVFQTSILLTLTLHLCWEHDSSHTGKQEHRMSRWAKEETHICASWPLVLKTCHPAHQGRIPGDKPAVSSAKPRDANCVA